MATKRDSKDFKIISNRDTLTKKAIADTIAHHITRKGDLFLPAEYAKTCQGCGKGLKDPIMYFGDYFCKNCVTEWTTPKGNA